MTISSPIAISVGSSWDVPSSRRISAPSTSLVWPVRAAPTESPWPTTNCTPGACWCWAGSWCRSTCGRWSSRCRSSWRGASRRSSRYVLSVISLVAYVLTKIAVGIFAGGVVFATLMPEVELKLGEFTLTSFWIGSVLVIIATGALHHSRRFAGRRLCRRVADRRAGDRLAAGDGLRVPSVGGWDELYGDLRFRDVQPLETAGAPRGGQEPGSP